DAGRLRGRYRAAAQDHPRRRTAGAPGRREGRKRGRTGRQAEGARCRLGIAPPCRSVRAQSTTVQDSVSRLRSTPTGSGLKGFEMKTLVLVEHDNQTVRDATLATVTA